MVIDYYKTYTFQVFTGRRKSSSKSGDEFLESAESYILGNSSR